MGAVGGGVVAVVVGGDSAAATAATAAGLEAMAAHPSMLLFIYVTRKTNKTVDFSWEPSVQKNAEFAALTAKASKAFECLSLSLSLLP